MKNGISPAQASGGESEEGRSTKAWTARRAVACLWWWMMWNSLICPRGGVNGVVSQVSCPLLKWHIPVVVPSDACRPNWGCGLLLPRNFQVVFLIERR